VGKANEIHFILACKVRATPPMLTTWPCKWKFWWRKVKHSGLAQQKGDWRRVAFSAAQSNLVKFCCRFCDSCVSLGRSSPLSSLYLSLSLSLKFELLLLFGAAPTGRAGGSSRAMGLSFQGKGTRPGSCFSFSFLVEFWGFCCETLMDVRCSKTEYFLSSFFLGRILVRLGWCFLICR
jgi:hypothetical protein